MEASTSETPSSKSRELEDHESSSEKNQWFLDTAPGPSSRTHSSSGVSSNESIWIPGPNFFYHEGDNFEERNRNHEQPCPEDINLSELWEELIEEVLSFDVRVLMTRRDMVSTFQKLLDECNEGNRLPSLVRMIWWEQESFLKAAYRKPGVNSIVKLIKKLKKSRHAFTVTAILSTKLAELMTNSTSKKVIDSCFTHFRQEANEVLYKRAITHCHYLATNKLGCIALNDCMTTISGEHRSRLLNAVADIADILCDDHYGNWVLQKAMKLNHGSVNGRIIDCLRGKFIYLSQRKVGSHTVEKCMEISEACMLTVVEEILQSPNAPRVLAEDKYGNYVLQKALLKTGPTMGFTNLYSSLVNSIEPYLSHLVKTKYGRNVIKAINKLKEPT